jgi:serralysin
MSDPVYTCHCPLCGGKTLVGDQLDAGSTSLGTPPLVPVIAYPYTGDYRIDALLLGSDQVLGSAPLGIQALSYRWNAGSPLGTPPLKVTYSFMTVKPFYGGTDDGLGDSGFSQFTAAEKAAVRQIMAQLQQTLGINIVEVTDSASQYGQIRLGNNFQEFSAGYTWLPLSTGDDRGGDVWIDKSVAGNASSIAPGSFAWATLVHEIGHAFGLKHPGNYNAGSAPSTGPGNYLGVVEDNTNYTIMSYRDVQAGQQRDWYGMYDLLTLKTLYGSGTPHPGDDVYTKQDSDGRTLEIIDDAGGFDTLDLSAVTKGAVMDLRPGGFSSVGSTANGSGAVNNLSISLSTTVEKFIGTPFGDTVTGNDAANQFLLGGGTNVADGGGGIDMAIYQGSRSSYQLTISGQAVSVSGPGLNDTLTNVERLAFADRNVAVDLGGAAGITAKTLGAVFGAPEVKDRPDYVGIGLALLDGGTSYEALMQIALNFREGTSATHAATVELLFVNIVGAEPSPEQSALFTSWLDSGSFTTAQLGVFAADNALNLAHIDFAGLSVRGIDYI